MTDSVQLVTADVPPVTLTVSRATLVAQSKVFADLLSLPVGDSAPPSLTLTETKAALEPFLSVLAGQTGDDATYRTLDFLGWQTLAALADKYDSPIVRHAVEAEIWRKLLSGKSPHEALSLATYTGPPSLIKAAALTAIKLDWLVQLRHIASDIAVERAAFTAQCYGGKWDRCTCDGMTDLSRSASWQALLFGKLCHFDPVIPFTATKEELPGICIPHQGKYRMQVDSMNSQYNDKAPKFPA
ncbi:hypothetical protein NBRC10513_003477 [Rhodotorula toruloides]